MNLLSGSDVGILIAELGERNFVFIILYESGQSKVRDNGDGIFVIRDESLQAILKCEDIKFVSENSATLNTEGVMTVSIAIVGNCSTLGDLGLDHYVLVLAEDRESVILEVKSYIGEFIQGGISVHDDYSLLSEREFIEFKRIKDTGGIGISAIRHPRDSSLIALGVLIPDRTLADIEECGMTAVDIDKIAHFFGNEFRQVIVAKNIRIANEAKSNNPESLVFALPQQIASLSYSERFFADIRGRTFCITRFRHTDEIREIKGLVSPEHDG